MKLFVGGKLNVTNNGVHEHRAFGVEPHSIRFFHGKLVTKMEKGFSFEIPKDKQKKLKELFLNVGKQEK